MKHHPDLARLAAHKIHKTHILSRNLVSILAVLVDLTAILLAVLISWQVYSGWVLKDVLDVSFIARHTVLFGFLFVTFSFMNKSYNYGAFLKETRAKSAVFNALNLAFIAFVGLIFLMKVSTEFSRGSVIFSYLFALPLLMGVRMVFSIYMVRLTKIGLITPERILLIGTQPELNDFATKFQPWNQGMMILSSEILPQKDILENDFDYHTRLKLALQEIVIKSRNMAFGHIFLSVSWSQKEIIDIIVDELMMLPASIHLTPESVLERFHALEVHKMGNISTLTLSRPPLSPLEVAKKRAFDIVAGSLILFIISPFMLLVALLIRKESEGKALFKQWRNGFNQNPFQIYKFRSMRVVEEGAAVKAATRNDSRITKVGAFIRKWNIDEVPQLINVIKGDMSLVGPRPHPLNLDAEEEKRVSFYAKRFNIKPGMTGWAQIHGLRGSVDGKNSMKKRIDYDIYYMDNWSVWLDVKIMIKTVTSKKAFENAF